MSSNTSLSQPTSSPAWLGVGLFAVPDRYIWLGLVTLLAIRLVAFSIWPGWHAVPGYASDGDSVDYHEIAVQIMETGQFAMRDGVATVTRPPAFPYWIALLYTLFGSKATWAGFLGQQLFLSGIALCAWLIARHLFDRPVALLTALLVSLDPVLNYLGWTYLTEPMHICLLLAGCYLFLRGLRARPGWSVLGWGVGAGVFWALAALTRPYFQLLPIFLIVLALPRGPRACRLACIAALAMVLGMSPWVIRNRLVVGQWVPLTLNSGVTLFGGNNQLATGDWVESAEHPELYADAPSSSELVSDSWYKQQAIQWIKAHPLAFLTLIPLKLFHLFSFYNFTVRASLSWMFFLGGLFPYLLCLPFAAAALIQKPIRKRIWPIAAIAAPTVFSAIIFYGDVRMRAPIEVFILMLAAYAIVRLTKKKSI